MTRHSLRWGISPATLVVAAAVQHGDRAAFVDERGTLSFVESDEHSSALAAGLAAHDIGAGPRVAIMAATIVASSMPCLRSGNWTLTRFCSTPRSTAHT